MKVSLKSGLLGEDQGLPPGRLSRRWGGRGDNRCMKSLIIRND